MDLSMIQQKLKTEEYDDVEQMSADIQLIVSNAKAVYGVSSAHILILSHLLTPSVSRSSGMFLRQIARTSLSRHLTNYQLSSSSYDIRLH